MPRAELVAGLLGRPRDVFCPAADGWLYRRQGHPASPELIDLARRAVAAVRDRVADYPAYAAELDDLRNRLGS